MDFLMDYTTYTAAELVEAAIDVEVISTLDKTMLGVRVTLAS